MPGAPLSLLERDENQRRADRRPSCVVCGDRPPDRGHWNSPSWLVVRRMTSPYRERYRAAAFVRLKSTGVNTPLA